MPQPHGFPKTMAFRLTVVILAIIVIAVAYLSCSGEQKAVADYELPQVWASDSLICELMLGHAADPDRCIPGTPGFESDWHPVDSIQEQQYQ